MHILVDFFEGLMRLDIVHLSLFSLNFVNDVTLVSQGGLRSDLLGRLGQVVRGFTNPRFATQNHGRGKTGGQLLGRDSDL